MNKKLIFIRYGVCIENFSNFSYPFIDNEILSWGYNKAIKDIIESKTEWYITACPTVLSATYDDNEPIWWDDTERTWNIYFIEKGKLRRIQEYTDKELRKAHNICKVYLNGILDD